MDMNDIISLGTKAFQDKMGGAEGADSSVVTEALSGLFSNEEGGFDLGNIISSVTSGEAGIGSVVSSWLGDGENDSVDGSQLTDLFGSDKIAAFAEKLGIDSDTALSGLSDAVPNIVDKASEGGSLVSSLLGAVTDSLGDVSGSVGDIAGNLADSATENAKGGIMGIIGKLFGK